MARRKITGDDIKLASIVDGNVVSISGGKVSSAVANATNATTATTASSATGISGAVVGWGNMVNPYAPNLLRNGGFDEDASAVPAGWTDVSGGTFSITVTGDGASPAFITSRPQVGVGRSRRLLRTSGSGAVSVLRQEIDLFAIGQPHLSQFVTANYVAIFAQCHVRTTIPNGAPPTGFISVTIIQDGSPVTTVTSSASSDFRPWRTIGIYAEPIIPPLTTLTSLVFRIDIGVNGGGTNASFDPVFFDDVCAYMQANNNNSFA